MQCRCSALSAFHWASDPRPSIFLADQAVTKGASTGLTMSQIQSASVDRITKETGRNPGSLKGMSANGDLRIEEQEAKRRTARAAVTARSSVLWNGKERA